jgi:23S rRNA (uridine2552-2'-O)-methyltransferase
MGGRADVVMSDMPPSHRPPDRSTPHDRLVETAAAFAADVLNPGGVLAKAFQSGADADIAQLKRDFASVHT